VGPVYLLGDREAATCNKIYHILWGAREGGRKDRWISITRVCVCVYREIRGMRCDCDYLDLAGDPGIERSQKPVKYLRRK
jgi:hypothetical protein